MIIRKYCIAVLIITIILISGCAQVQELLKKDKIEKTQQSTEIKSSIEANNKEVKTGGTAISPIEQLVFSQETKDYASEYCDVVLEDVKVEITPVKNAQDTAVVSEGGGGEIQPFQPRTSETKPIMNIDTTFVKNILKKLPITNLDSSITLGITTRTESGFKSFYAYISSGEPIVKEQAFDFDATKMVLTIPYDTMLELGRTSSNNICNKFRIEISNENIGYDLHFGVMDSFKSGVSELKNCLQ